MTKRLTTHGGAARVLIATSDEPLGSALRHALEDAGHVVAAAASGDETLRALDVNPPEAVVLDVDLPFSEEITACKRVRRHPAGRTVPLLIVSDATRTETIRRAFEHGATDVVLTPVQPLVLTRRIGRLVDAKRAADALRRSKTKLVRVQRVAGLGHYRWDLQSRSLVLSPAAAKILGVGAREAPWPLDELLRLVHDDDRELVGSTLVHCLSHPRAYEFEHRLAGDATSIRIVRHEAELDLDEAASMSGIVQDVTVQRQTQERVHYLAHFDSVTGLPNRALVKELLRTALINARRNEQSTAILHCDLDNFKQINDTMGHGHGDALLESVALRLESCVRSGRKNRGAGLGDYPWHSGERTRDVVARIGADEFVILLTEVRRAEDAVKVVKRIREACSRPFHVRGHTLTTTMSIGISVFPQDGDDIETLLKNADAAMYQAKRDGRDSSQFYTEAIHTRAVRRFSLETALRGALERDELLLNYQPKIGLNSGKVIGVEALVRWQSPERGLVSPAEFIPLAEETGLIVPIGEWILRTACEQTGRWRETIAPDLELAVNLSARQFREADLAACVSRALAETGLPAECLELELTESLLMEDTERCLTQMHAIRKAGATLAIDDFGTGYSSLGYLKRFPINTLKIDRTFVHDLERDKPDASIVSAIVLLAHQLGLRVVAEGVENRTQLEFLRFQSCDAAQGFLFSRPLDADACGRWLGGELRIDNEATSETKQPV